MARIEDYALIGDLESAALVGRNGSIDWFCAPRFDSPACFAALLGNEDNGFWRIAPVNEVRHSSRRYRDDSLVLETHFETATGAATLIDFMPIRPSGSHASIVRLVRGERGVVPMRMELAVRFDYGQSIPWVHKARSGLNALSGPNTMDLETPVPMVGRDFRTFADFSVDAGEVVPFTLTYRDSLARYKKAGDPVELCDGTERWWQEWIKSCTYEGPWREAVVRSLITLKALTHQRTGGIVAAPTTSLPEEIGGERNWDYRFCWLRDATFTLYSLLISGLHEEAEQWRSWLLRVAAGQPAQLQTIYALDGNRLLPESEIDWLGGYEASQPVRIGNQAHRQLQIDIYGEVMDVFQTSRRVGIKESSQSWALQRALMDFVEAGWKQPDNGIWEVRGRRRHFTHSKVMAWVALDRAVKACETYGLEGPLDRWRQIRDQIHMEVCRRGFDVERQAFVQYYGSGRLDASLLMMPLVGFLPITDGRCLSTVSAIERDLVVDGFVRRYTPDPHFEGLHGQEGAFLPCTFWLADNYALLGRDKDASDLFERLLAVRNDVGLLSEEYNPRAKRQLGNFPQAFSHVSLINTAFNLTQVGPATQRTQV